MVPKIVRHPYKKDPGREDVRKEETLQPQPQTAKLDAGGLGFRLTKKHQCGQCAAKNH